MRRILVIDDEEGFCSAIKTYLQMVGGFEVAFATDGRSGLKLALKEKPDLVILDVLMPEMDGLMVLQKLKEDYKTTSIPVMILSACHDDGLKKDAQSHYGEMYVEKPISAQGLLDKINEVFGRLGK